MTTVSIGDMARLIDITPTMDTSAYASGDVLFDATAVPNISTVGGKEAWLNSVVLIDADDQKAALDLIFLSANVSVGTANAAPSISDANAANFLGRVSIATADYYDLGGVSVAEIKGIQTMLKAADEATSCYVAAVNGTGTPTYTASGLKLRLGVLRDR